MRIIQRLFVYLGCLFGNSGRSLIWQTMLLCIPSIDVTYCVSYLSLHIQYMYMCNVQYMHTYVPTNVICKLCECVALPHINSRVVVYFRCISFWSLIWYYKYFLKFYCRLLCVFGSPDDNFEKSRELAFMALSIKAFSPRHKLKHSRTWNRKKLPKLDF